MYFFSSTSATMLMSLQPPLQQVLQDAIAITPVDFGIVYDTGGFRTAEDQNRLYRSGKSSLDGYNKKSYHQTGWAVDVFAYANGKAIWDGREMFEVIATIMEVGMIHGLVMEWGGLWEGKSRDTPHIQVMGPYE